MEKSGAEGLHRLLLQWELPSSSRGYIIRRSRIQYASAQQQVMCTNRGTELFPVAQNPLKMFWYHHGKDGQSSCQWLQVHKLLVTVVKGSWWNLSSVLYLADQVGKFQFSPRGLFRVMCSSGFTFVKKSLRRRKNNLAEIVRQILQTSRLPEIVNILFPMQESSKVYEQNGSGLFLWAPGQAFERWQYEKQGCGSFSVGFAACSL